MSEQGDGAAPGGATGGQAQAQGALGRRQKVTADVMTRATEVTELEDGYELHYPRTAAWRELPNLGYIASTWSRRTAVRSAWTSGWDTPTAPPPATPRPA